MTDEETTLSRAASEAHQEWEKVFNQIYLSIEGVVDGNDRLNIARIRVQQEYPEIYQATVDTTLAVNELQEHYYKVTTEANERMNESYKKFLPLPNES